jgi:hypothetical protein
MQSLADLTERLLADVEAGNEERLADGALITGAKDRMYMRVTEGHIVFSVTTGFQGIIKTADVRSLDVDPPVEKEGQKPYIPGVIRSHHPADPDHVTRSYSFWFPADGRLLAAIRAACNLPEEPPEDEAAAAAESAEAPGPADPA